MQHIYIQIFILYDFFFNFLDIALYTLRINNISTGICFKITNPCTYYYSFYHQLHQLLTSQYLTNTLLLTKSCDQYEDGQMFRLTLYEDTVLNIPKSENIKSVIARIKQENDSEI